MNIIVKSYNILSFVSMDLFIQVYFIHTDCLHLANRVDPETSSIRLAYKYVMYFVNS